MIRGRGPDHTPIPARVEANDQDAAGSTGTVTYTDDSDGNRTSMANSTGITRYAYDKDNRLTSVTYP